MTKLIECVPNFSEGRNLEIIEEIINAITSVDDVVLLHTDRGEAVNRTVITFAGSPEPVSEAAFRAMKKAAQLIDMSRHKGVHPRFGATDVCPLIPLAGISMEETAGYARRLAERAGSELNIPVYCYEYAAFSEERRSLASCRAGGYEGLKEKMSLQKLLPDFGPAEWSEQVAATGATAIGARKILIAYNINLKTKSKETAQKIATEVRESGKTKSEKNQSGEKLITERIHGSLKKVRAIGWFIDEYEKAQVSMNLADISVTPLHTAFEEVSRQAAANGTEVTGSELVGLAPLKAILDAGKYFLQKYNYSTEISDKYLVDTAIKFLGLDELSPFNPEEKIIEYLFLKKSGKTININF